MVRGSKDTGRDGVQVSTDIIIWYEELFPIGVVKLYTGTVPGSGGGRCLERKFSNFCSNRQD